MIDSKNGSVPKSPGKVLKRTVTEDIVTTFSSPAAWLLVVALIITWSAVAVVMFDLVDYRNLSGKIHEIWLFNEGSNVLPTSGFVPAHPILCLRVTEFQFSSLLLPFLLL